MHRACVIALAMLVLSATLTGHAAAAMPVAVQTLDRAAADAAPVRKVVNVCGLNGCARVQTARIVHHRYRHP